MIKLISILYLIPAILIGSIAAIFLKQSSKKFTLNIKKLLKNHKLILGATLYLIASFFYIQALRYGKLSVIYPLSSLSYIVISILSVKLLNEKMTKQKWFGIIFIIFGSFLIVNG